MKIARILETKGPDIVTIAAGAVISDAVDLLNRHNIGALVVVDGDGRVTGILSERDIVRRLKGLAGMLSQPVSAIMTRDPVTCTREEPVDDIMEMMTTRHFRHVPVVEDGRLIGVVSIGDVVKTKIAATENEAAALREYIAS